MSKIKKFLLIYRNYYYLIVDFFFGAYSSKLPYSIGNIGNNFRTIS